MPGLSDKIAIITGASSGIGYATAKRFAQEGAHVVVGVRRQPELNALIEEITRASDHAVALAGDVKSEAFAKALVELAMDCFGGLDIAFNNASTTGETGSILDMSIAEWEDTLSPNLTSAFVSAKHQIRPCSARVVDRSFSR
ncbi:SDR family NAD(P)-dependent oxidoreductase [Dickeya dadantii]|uniref:SDR family NAD(P)-dependent oxidoreductase n=1 Tax=Dickeya dadantii TaxID=204038 RepID=UPI0020A674D0|nr:SDR family NAD(P)-dependent oxidoreductase [Dickeya dadantii]